MIYKTKKKNKIRLQNSPKDETKTWSWIETGLQTAAESGLCTTLFNIGATIFFSSEIKGIVHS